MNLNGLIPNSSGKEVLITLLYIIRKQPSFARIQRIWQTTKRFWEEGLDEIQDALKDVKEKRGKRLRVFAHSKSLDKDDFRSTHSYEFKLNGVEFSLYCVKGVENGNENLEFVTNENLSYISDRTKINLLNIEQAKGELENKELKSDEGYLLEIERLKEDETDYMS